MAEDRFVEMMIDGKLTKVSEKVLASRGMREKKVEVTIKGKKIRVMPHMLKDIAKFGGTETRRTIKEPPNELLTISSPKKLILPRKVEEIIPVQEIKPIDLKPIEFKEVESADYPSVSDVIAPAGSVKAEKKVVTKKVTKKAKK
jgi:hypothetical protein